MPTIVELPGENVELEFPDEMSRTDMEREIIKRFPSQAPKGPSTRAMLPMPGERIATREGVTQPILQAFPAREQAIQEAQRTRQPIEAPLPSVEQQKAMLTGVAQPEAEIPTYEGANKLLRGASQVASGILNRPEYLASLLNPATATAVAATFLPEVAKQFLEDLGKGVQGDDEALGRAAAIGIPALFGVVKGGRTLTERLNAQTALEKAQAASSAAHIDAMARLEAAPRTAEPQPLAGAPISMRPSTERAGVLVPTARELTPQEAEDVFGLGKLTQQSNELLTQSAAELRQLERERTPDAISQRETAQVPLEVPPGDRGEVGAQVRKQATPEETLARTREDDARAETAAANVPRNVEAQTPVAPQVEPQSVGSAAQPMTPVRQIALDELVRQGWNPKWPFVQADLLNKSFRDAIRADPTLSSEEKGRILSFGPKDEPSIQSPQELTPNPQVAYRAASSPAEVAGKDVSFSKGNFQWYEGEPFLIEGGSRASKAVEQAGGEADYRRGHFAPQRIFYRLEAFNTPEEAAAELSEIRKQYPGVPLQRIIWSVDELPGIKAETPIAVPDDFKFPSREPTLKVKTQAIEQTTGQRSPFRPQETINVLRELDRIDNLPTSEKGNAKLEFIERTGQSSKEFKPPTNEDDTWVSNVKFDPEGFGFGAWEVTIETPKGPVKNRVSFIDGLNNPDLAAARALMMHVGAKSKGWDLANALASMGVEDRLKFKLGGDSISVSTKKVQPIKPKQIAPTPTPKVEPATAPAPALTEGGAPEAGKATAPAGKYQATAGGPLPADVKLPVSEGLDEAGRKSEWDRYIADSDRYNREITQWEKAQPTNKAILFKNPKTGSYTAITKDPQGGWRATMFSRIFTDDERLAPWGHERYKTRLEAVKANRFYELATELPEIMTEADIRAKSTRPPQVEPAPIVKPAAAPAKRKGIERPWDIIDELQSQIGTIRSKSAAKAGSEGYYTPEFHALSQSGASRKLFGKTGVGPDDALAVLKKSGFIGPDATVGDLVKPIEQANAQRRAIAQGQTPEIQADKFQTAISKQAEKKSSPLISVGDLSKGDKFRVGGEEFEVVSIDPDTGEVTVKDGRKFGHQTIPDGADIPIEKGSFEQTTQSQEFLPPETEQPKPAVKTPKLAPGETQGDLIGSTQREDFALIGERGTDVERAVAEKAKAEQTKKEAAELTKKHQMELPGAEPSVGPGAASRSDIAGGQTVVSNMFAAIDRDRAAMGKPPMEPGEPRTWDEDRQIATARMNRDPQWIPDLIKEVNDNPRPLLSWENAGMVMQKAYWKAEANNALSRIAKATEDNRTNDLVDAQADAKRFEDKILEMETAVGRGGTGSEAGRTLQAQKMGLTDDLSLVEMRLEARGKVGGRPLTDAESREISQIHAEYERNLKAISEKAESSKRAEVEANARAALAELGRQAAEAKVPPPHIQTIVNRIGDVIHSQANAARERLRGKLFTIGDPEVLLDLARVGADNIWTLGEDFARWSVKMVEDIGEHVRPHLQQIWDASKQFINDTTDAAAGAKRAVRGTKAAQTAQTVKDTISRGDTPEAKIGKLITRIERRVRNNEVNKIAPAVQQLARQLMEQGLRGRDELVKRLHQILEPMIPNWTEYDTRQALSGYGDYKRLSKDEISRELRTYKGQLQQMLKLEDMANKQAPLRTGLERREVTPAERQLIKLVNEAKRRGGYTTTNPETQLRTALDEVKKRTQTSIEDYERRLREEDFTVRKLEPIKPDPELQRLQAQQKRIIKKWEEFKRQKELAARKPWQKVLDKFVRWERAFKLSSPVVFGKLTAAALTRVATTATEETAGLGIKRIPGIATVARQAPREGTGLNVRQFAQSIAKAVTDGMRDARQTAMKGAADIDVLYGEKIIDKDWANVFGQFHGMFKAPVKRMEFEYSLAKRIEDHVNRTGQAPDELEMIGLSSQALNDGYRTIFMQRGATSDFFNQIVTQMEHSKKYPVQGEVYARIARFLLPIVRVPVNIVAETSTGVYGVPAASARVMFHAIKGTLDTLDPVVADSIMRQFKKGSIGLGLMAIGYFNPQAVGGYDWREKRQPGAAKTSGFQLKSMAGIWPADKDGNIPRWVTHAPWFELMQIGGTIRHVKDQHVKGTPKGVGEGLWAAGLGLVEETPFVNEMLQAGKLFDSNQRSQWLGAMARGTLVPQAVQKIAALTDTAEKRKPTNVLQGIEMGIPGLRQNVPPPKVRGTHYYP